MQAIQSAMERQSPGRRELDQVVGGVPSPRRPAMRGEGTPPTKEYFQTVPVSISSSGRGFDVQQLAAKAPVGRQQPAKLEPQPAIVERASCRKAVITQDRLDPVVLAQAPFLLRQFFQ